MHPNVADVLRDQGVTTPTVAVQLPRFRQYCRRFEELGRCSPAHPDDSLNVLYATGSYKWHGLGAEAQLQDSDLADLVAFARCHPEVAVRIRVHPREDASEYRRRSWPDNLEFSNASRRSPLEDVAWSSVLVTARSTMALEAQLVGVPVIIYTANFAPPDRRSVLGSDPYFHCSDSLEELLRVGDGGARTHASHLPDGIEVIAERLLDLYGRSVSTQGRDRSRG